MSDKPSIIYMGTPEFAVAPLKSLTEKKFDIKAVITVPDKPAGRGQKIRTSAVKDFALSKGLNILQPKNLKDSDFIQELEKLNADLFIVIAFRMLPKQVWQLPKLGTFNIHGSLLPEYRGAAPINWAIINGEKITGVTSFFINEEIDSGAIIDKVERNIEAEDSAGSLHDKLMKDASQLILSTIDKIVSPSFKPLKQEVEDKNKPAPKIFKEHCKIDWNLNSQEIHNFIRGLSPYPVAQTIVKEDDKTIGTIRVFKASYTLGGMDAEIGTMKIENGEILGKTKDGWLKIEELQWPGKKKMDTRSFLNGFRTDKTLKLG